MYLTEILQECAVLEGRIARVYRQLAERVDRDAARLWRELALGQETHADILRRELQSFQEADDSGAYFPEYAARLQRLSALLRKIEARALAVQTPDEALATSVALEQSELEDIYDDVVLQGEPAFRLISERIEAALNNLPPASTPRTAPKVASRQRPARRRA